MSHSTFRLRRLAVRAMRSGQRCLDRCDYATAGEVIDLAADLAEELADHLEVSGPEQAAKWRLIARLRRHWAAEADTLALTAS
ncbi:hypothetical protein CLV69_11729 [Amycolatopsis arida]|nr:hypothetical protein CLV69_11729 [Amycolatopsis arida]